MTTMTHKVLTYLPHGEIPDSRGFAPALVAQNLAKYQQAFQNLHVCAAEALPEGRDTHPEWGDIVRIKEGRLYRRLFRKLTKLDPYPLHQRLAKVANAYEPDIIHIHQLEFPVSEFRRLLKKPARIIVHGHTIRAYEPAFGMADLYLAASRHIADGLVAGGYPQDNMQVLLNGIDVARFTPLAPADKTRLRAALGIAPQVPVLLFFGRKQAVKGFDLFLKTVEALRLKTPGLTAIAIGPTPANTRDDAAFAETSALQTALVTKGVLQDFGPMPHETIARYLQAADIAILPSRDEPQGMAMIEAMAAGLIVVSGNVGGIRESIHSGIDGVLVETVHVRNDENHVLPVVADILENPEPYRQMGSNAHKSATARFDWRILGAELAQIYQDLVT